MIDINIHKILDGSAMPSKSDAEHSVRMAKKAVVEGWQSAVPYFIAAKYLEVAFKALKEDEEFKNAAIGEIEAAGQAGITIHGAKVTKMATGKIDYSNTPEWVRVADEIERLNAYKKALEDAAKAMPEGVMTTALITEDGEEIIINRPTRTGGWTVKVELPK